MNFPTTGLRAELCLRLEQAGITTPTPIQEQAIPVVMRGHDLIGIAQTGTGKTFAFGLPLIHHFSSNQGSALILAPTRELAIQIEASLLPFAQLWGMQIALLVGGSPMGNQTRALRNNPRIVVATPGRLMDHASRGTVRLKQFTHVVLDEGDRMLDMGFIPAIKQIFARLNEDRQTLMFSATFAPEIATLAQEFLTNPERVEVAPEGTTLEQIEQAVYIVGQDEKSDLLDDLIRNVQGPVLVFARTRHGARKVAKALRSYGHAAVEIHADRTQSQRDQAMATFRSGANRVLVATDIAARGIDVKDIELVVQFDLPDVSDDYVHRIGRTGRAGAEGRAVILVTPEHSKKLDKMEDHIGFEIATAEDSPLARPQRTFKHRPRSARREPLAPARARSSKPRAEIAKEPIRFEDNPRPRQEAPRPADRSPRQDRPQYDRPQHNSPREPQRFERPQLGYRNEGPRQPERFERPQPQGYRNDRPQYDTPREPQRFERPQQGYRNDGPRQPERFERPQQGNRNERPQEERPSYDQYRNRESAFQNERKPSENQRFQNDRFQNRESGPRQENRDERPRFDDRPQPRPQDAGPPRRESTGMSSKPWERKSGPKPFGAKPKGSKFTAKKVRPGLKPAVMPGSEAPVGRPKPDGTPKAYKGKPKKGGVPRNGFQPPKRKGRDH